MKNNLSWILLFGFLFSSFYLFSQKEGCCASRALRIMSYNIRNGSGMDGVADYRRTARVINGVAPDVVAVQEVDSMTNRSNRTDVLGVLAGLTCMHPTYAAAIDYDGGKYGIGILSKEKPLKVYRLPLPGREEARTFLMAEFPGYVFCATHLSLTTADRMLSLPVIKQAIGNMQKPVFIAGDLNADPRSEFIKELEKDFTILSDTSLPTFPADQPDTCLDYIVLYKNGNMPVTFLRNAVINAPVESDHRPIRTDVILKAKPETIFKTAPYLQNPADNGMTVMWHTTVPCHSWVEYGTDTTRLIKKQPVVDGQVVSNTCLHKIRLENLVPGQKYYYRVCSREITLYGAYKKEFGETAVSGFASFSLPDKKSSDFTVVVFNDLHKTASTLSGLYEQIKDIPYDLVICNGDIVDDPHTAADAVNFISKVNSTLGGNEVPIIYLRGNHEIRNAYSLKLKEQFDYIGGKTYGAFNWGDTRFVLLDCGEDKPDDHWVYYGLNDFAQLRADEAVFLKKEVASPAFKKAVKRVLVHHIPIYGETDRYNPCRELWEPFLLKASFDISLNAHTHRFSYYPEGKAGNPYPVVIGGGYKPESATVMVLQKKDKEMSLKVINIKGETILDIKL